MDKRLHWLSVTVGLDRLDTEVLKHLVRAHIYEPYGTLMNFFGEGHAGRGEVNIEGLAAATGRQPLLIHRRLEAQSSLRQAGLVRDCRGGDYGTTNFAVRVARLRSVQPAVLARHILSTAPPSSLEWADFGHLGEPAELAKQLIVEAARRRCGINILLYGRPGTGKSEFARVLAETARLHPVLVGATDEEGGEPDRSERLAHLAVCRSLVRASPRHLLVVDEAEDLMIRPVFGLRDGGNSKLYLNRLVESSTSPTVWIVNQPDLLGGPVLRRMALALEFSLPSRAVRRRVLERLAIAEDVPFRAADLAGLSKIEVAPAVLASAVRAAAWTDKEPHTAALAARSIQKVMGGSIRPDDDRVADFDPSLSEGDMDLNRLVDRLARATSQAWSLLAAGPPGTGKSALARHIAAQAGMDVLERRASDLLNMFVGGTEKAIAEAFREAADTKAMLIIDEADTLLRNRSLAQRSWEVSMTNEMLTWMERSPTPFVATTNLRESLDPATSRRFLFKVELQGLTPAKARRLFQHYFGSEPPSTLDHVPELAPGDFALVARKARLLGITEPSRLVELLEVESLAKGARHEKRIGFGF
ncbi:AAA family ATPase [Altererythrobacter sp. TH136]|uniref:AAA family ATPase n=1 Tax=Altererythrobacter sp. TH136 TaxID=2067415 RepID=UPI00143DEE59|nr:AAA family ATPase [Altererythrobacter sp. TH136]